MHCPRCGGELATFAVEGGGESAVVCESCGFAGVPASHRPEAVDAESWEQAIERFDETLLAPERTCRTGRDKAVRPPAADSDPAIDPARLEESLPVAASLRGAEDEKSS